MAGRSLRTLTAVLPLLALTLAILGTAQTAQPARYFPDTGHTVQNQFLQFFDSRGGLAIFGYPITGEYVDPQSGMLVQYFQRARMEWHPNHPDPYKVQLGLLGDQLDKRRPPLPANAVPATPDCQFFPETGHAVCYAFLDFFRKNGGIDIFGYPISEFDVEGGITVQYFQRARMEWRPEKPTGQRVQLTPLGSIHFNASGSNPRLLDPKPFAARPETKLLTDLRLSATVSVPVAQPNGVQTVFLVVRNQLGQPVAGATASVVVRYADGTRTSFTLPPSDANGMARGNFAIDRGRPGQFVTMDFRATHGDLVRTTSTSFLLWW